MLRGKGWLETHPLKDAIALRYLKHQRSLAREALSRLVLDEGSDPAEVEAVHQNVEEALESKINLHDQRLQIVSEVLQKSGAKKVLDLGCGEGKLLKLLLRSKQFEEIVGLDVSIQSLERAKDRLQLDQLRAKDAARIKLVHGSLMYRDHRLSGFDAAAVVEVIEHLDAPRLVAFERVLFEFARPDTVVVTTPNSEYNVKFENLPAGKFRHKDHRFEWSRKEFATWCESICQRFNYKVDVQMIGEVDSSVGGPTQMGIFSR